MLHLSMPVAIPSSSIINALKFDACSFFPVFIADGARMEAFKCQCSAGAYACVGEQVSSMLWQRHCNLLWQARQALLGHLPQLYWHW